MDKILIVGGSHGIGAALVEALKNTHQLFVISRTKPVEHANITHFQVNILEDDLPKIEHLDGLVYCPGSINLKPLRSLKLEHITDDFNINVLAAVKTIKHYESVLKKSAKASVVLFSSVATQLGMPFHTSVAISKSAIEGMVKSLAAEYITKIRFNTIAPTVTDTPLAEKLLKNDKLKEMMANRHPLKRYLQAAEVADLSTFLLSEKSSAITGQVFPMDLGITTLKV